MGQIEADDLRAVWRAAPRSSPASTRGGGARRRARDGARRVKPLAGRRRRPAAVEVRGDAWRSGRVHRRPRRRERARAAGLRLSTARRRDPARRRTEALRDPGRRAKVARQIGSCADLRRVHDDATLRRRHPRGRRPRLPRHAGGRYVDWSTGEPPRTLAVDPSFRDVVGPDPAVKRLSSRALRAPPAREAVRARRSRPPWARSRRRPARRPCRPQCRGRSRPQRRRRAGDATGERRRRPARPFRRSTDRATPHPRREGARN